MALPEQTSPLLRAAAAVIVYIGIAGVRFHESVIGWYGWAVLDAMMREVQPGGLQRPRAVLDITAPGAEPHGVESAHRQV